MSTVVIENNIPKLIADMDNIVKQVADKGGAFLEVKLIERIDAQDPRWEALKAETIKRKGSSHAWVDTGELEGLITHRIVMNGKTVEVQAGIFNHEKGYIAAILEYGTPLANIPERPLFRPILIENKDRLVELLKEWLAAECKRYALEGTV